MTGDRGAVFLLTDYGNEDEFAGVTRAVVLRQAPGAPVVDLTHAIPPFDVRAGALTLARSVVHLGPGVVVAVVDPGVGTGRRAVAVAVGERDDPRPRPRFLLGPDNGVLGWALAALGGASAAVSLPAAAGGTFDGRDLFAPVAARLWSGAGLNDVGLPIEPRSLVELPSPRLVVEPPGPAGGAIEAEILWIDRFGNAQTAARAGDGEQAGLGEAVQVVVGKDVHRARRVEGFDRLSEEEIGLLVDANGHLALVGRRRSAATVLGVRPGDVIRLHPVAGDGR
jgi:S-adenosyl-L-methionine hydrolase (adenosine-forming)